MSPNYSLQIFWLMLEETYNGNSYIIYIKIEIFFNETKNLHLIEYTCKSKIFLLFRNRIKSLIMQLYILYNYT